MHFTPWRTVRGRLVLAALLVEFVMLGIMVGNSLRLLRDEMGDQSREQAEQIAPVLSAALVAPMAQFDYATVQAVLDESHAVRGIDYLAVKDSSGAIVATSGWPITSPLPPVDPSFTLNDDSNPPRYDVSLPIRLSGQTLGTLQFGLDLTRILVARKNLLTQGILIAMSEMLLSAGLLALLGMLVTRRLSLLTQASLTVAKGQLTPGPVPEGQDDVGRLGAAFNVMSRAIADRVGQLTLANETTQRMAAQLQDKNVQLEHSYGVVRVESQMRLDTQHELEAALARVRDRTEQLNAIFDLSPDGIVSFDAELRVKYASPAFLNMTGLEHDRIVSMDEDGFSEALAALCIDPDRFPGIATIKSRAMAERPGTRDTTDKVASAGRRIVMDLAGPGKRVLEVGMRLSDADSVSQIVYFRDITHETEVDRMKSEFLSHAAHELRTPMASIYGYAELMIARDFEAQERGEFLGIIHRQSEMMIAIINELLDLVRIEERRGKDFEFVQTDVGKLVHDVVADFGVPAGHPPAVADVELGGYWIWADQKKIMQAVGNILSNAYKYSPGGGDVRIVLAHEGDQPADGPLPQRVGIRVTDHGIGMTPSQTARVCERFYRADASGSIPGTGLGMCIVKEIVELHGGTVAIESSLGAGTMVTLWMPAMDVDAVPTTA